MDTHISVHKYYFCFEVDLNCWNSAMNICTYASLYLSIMKGRVLFQKSLSQKKVCCTVAINTLRAGLRYIHTWISA